MWFKLSEWKDVRKLYFEFLKKDVYYIPELWVLLKVNETPVEYMHDINYGLERLVVLAKN